MAIKEADRKIIEIPAAIFAEGKNTVEAIPSKFWRQFFIGIFITIFSGVMALPIMLNSDDTINGHGTVFFVLMSALLFATGAIGIAFVFKYLSPSKFLRMRVNSDGIFYESKTAKHEVLWNRIEKEHGIYDVKAEISSGEAMIWYLQFHPYKISLQLADFQPFPISFKNAFALRRQILLNLALRNPSLLFDPMVFVHAKINPETWEPMPWPRKIYFAITLLPIFPVIAILFAAPTYDLPGTGWVIATILFVVLFVLIPIAFFSSWLWMKFFPQWNEAAISFKR